MRTLLVTSPLMSGSDVSDLQTALNSMGYDCGQVDGLYGAATSGAVSRFQKANSLEVDGIAGPITLGKVNELMSANHTSPEEVSHLGELVLAEAEKWIGTAENPKGSNMQPFGAWFNVNGVAWCCEAVSYWYKIGGGYELCKGTRGIGVVPGRGCTSVPTVEGWLRTSGFWLGKISKPLPGDIVIFELDGDAKADHIGIVKSVNADGTVQTIEGNYSNKVEEVHRHTNVIKGYGRISL